MSKLALRCQVLRSEATVSVSVSGLRSAPEACRSARPVMPIATSARRGDAGRPPDTTSGVVTLPAQCARRRSGRCAGAASPSAVGVHGKAARISEGIQRALPHCGRQGAFDAACWMPVSTILLVWSGGDQTAIRLHEQQCEHHEPRRPSDGPAA